MKSTEISSRARALIFAILIAGAFITAMSTTVTANMIPDFTEAFGVSTSLAQWLTSGATLIAGITIPVTAFLIRRLSNRTYFLLTMGAYTLGSIGAVFSGSFILLLFSRMVQAVGCGMMVPFAQVILMNLYPAEKHGTVLSTFSMASMVSTVVGPTYAGLMLEAAGWKGVFLSLAVLGAIILIAGAIMMRDILPKEEAHLNVLYVLLSAFGFSALIIGIGDIATAGFFSLAAGGLMLAGVILLAVFARLQLTSTRPMLNLHVFKESTFVVALFVSICLYLISMRSSMILPIFTKSICGYSDAAYGYVTLPGSILAVFATLAAGKLYDRKGIKPMFAAGITLFVLYAISGILFTPETSLLMISIVFAGQSIAMAVMNSPATTMALSNLNGSLKIDGSAAYNTIRQVASSLASTVAVLVYTLSGSGLTGIHVVFWYFLGVSLAIFAGVMIWLHLQKQKP